MMNALDPVLTPREMREWEQAAFSRGVSPLLLMEDAARALHDRLCPLLGDSSPDRVLIVCGTGNNGGDGAALGRLLLLDGIETLLLYAGEPATDSARVMRTYYEALGGRTLVCASEADWEKSHAEAEAFRPGCVVDALFGTGFHGAPEGPGAALIRWINRLNAPVTLAVDVPSGMNGADGQAAPDPETGGRLCVRATHTVTLGFWKPGLLLTRHPEYIGQAALAPIALPREKPRSAVQLLGVEALNWIPPRPADAHKGTAGRVLIYMGSPGMAGAAAMAAKAALRAGAGLVTVACPREIIPVLQTLVPNAMCVAAESLADGVPAHDVLAAGCGLGQSAQAREILVSLLARENGIAVLDADALNLLAQAPFPLPARTVLTPHPGEAARLLHMSAEAVLDDPAGAARSLARQYGAVALLKSHVSLASDGERVLIQQRGSPALAKGGSGDALTGILAALCADRSVCAALPEEGRLLYRAGLASLWLGLAGEEAQREWGSRSALTGDVIDSLWRAYTLCQSNG